MKQASSTEEVFGLLREATDPPVMTARMVADRIDVSKVTAARYLDEVVEQYDAQMTTVGRTNIYWAGGTAPTEEQLQDAAGRVERDAVPKNGRPAEDSHTVEERDESGTEEEDSRMSLPGLFFLLALTIGPIYFVLALLDGTILNRLRDTLEVSTSESQIQRTRYGPAGVYLAVLAAALGLIMGVAVGIVVLNVGAGVAAWAVRITLGVVGMGALGSVVAAYNAMPAWDSPGATNGVSAK